MIFAANFGTDGKVYAFLHMPSRIVGGTPEERWIQMGVNVGPDRIEGDEGIVGIIGKELRDGCVVHPSKLDTWAMFEVRVRANRARASCGVRPWSPRCGRS